MLYQKKPLWPKNFKNLFKHTFILNHLIFVLMILKNSEKKYSTCEIKKMYVQLYIKYKKIC
jgi:hypothetical protein